MTLRPLSTLFLSPRQPLPANSGAKLRDYHLAKALGMAGRLTYLHFGESKPLDFAAYYAALPRPAGYTAGKILRGVAGRWPISVLNYLSRAMSRKIEEVVRGCAPVDLVQIDALQMSGYLPLFEKLLPIVPIVFDWHNVESELMRRYSANVASSLKKAYASHTAKRLESLELSLLCNARYAHIVCSEREREQLLDLAPQARIAVVPNGVDTHYFTQAGLPARNRIVFVGSMNYHANIEAASYFARQIWPEVRARFPEWKLILVGATPAAEVVALGQLPGVEVTGTVEDVRPYYGSAVAAIVPLRTGGGTRLKILEAMAAGVPVVSTAVGAEGLKVQPGNNILIAESTAEWISAFQALCAQERWQSLAEAGLSLVRNRYDWDVIGRGMVDIYASWVNRLRE